MNRAMRMEHAIRNHPERSAARPTPVGATVSCGVPAPAGPMGGAVGSRRLRGAHVWDGLSPWPWVCCPLN